MVVAGGGLLRRRGGAAQARGEIAQVGAGQLRIGLLLGQELLGHPLPQDLGHLGRVIIGGDMDRGADRDVDGGVAASEVLGRFLGPDPL